MADAVDSKSTTFTGITVQVRAPAPPQDIEFIGKYSVLTSLFWLTIKYS